MSTCFPCMEGDHKNCGRGNRVDMLECRCDTRTPDCPGQVLQRSGYTFDQAHAPNPAAAEAKLPESTKMRLRILELPQRMVGEVAETPYALILDRCPLELRSQIAEVMNHDTVVKQLGANGALVFSEEVELG